MWKGVAPTFKFSNPAEKEFTPTFLDFSSVCRNGRDTGNFSVQRSSPVQHIGEGPSTEASFDTYHLRHTSVTHHVSSSLISLSSSIVITC